MALITRSYLQSKAQASSGYLSESNIRNFSAGVLARENSTASVSQAFDIFLSHALEDAILIKGLRDELVEAGWTVYVDWINDPQMDRRQVTKDSAALLRSRMQQCRCLLYATSVAAKESIWMPWELGYLDAKTGSRVAIVPMVADTDAQADFRGQEYLGLYPYLDKTGSTLYVHLSTKEWVNFKDWLNGQNPYPR